MAMQLGGKAGAPRADINVTPLIDIVLVLLIIFMVLTPMSQRAYDMSIPEKSPDSMVNTIPADQLIVTVLADGAIQLNKDPTQLENVKTRLEDLLRHRQQKIVFFQADDRAIYERAVKVMDAIKAAGGTVGLVTTDIQ